MLAAHAGMQMSHLCPPCHTCTSREQCETKSAWLRFEGGQASLLSPPDMCTSSGGGGGQRHIKAARVNDCTASASGNFYHELADISCPCLAD